jgi:hypothetical protein
LEVRTSVFDNVIIDENFEKDLPLKVDYSGVYQKLKGYGFEYSIVEYNLMQIKLCHKIEMNAIPRFLYAGHPKNKYDAKKLYDIWKVKLKTQNQRDAEMSKALITDFFEASDEISKNYDNILYLRINYPISDTHSSKNLLTKLLSYNNIDDCQISITYIDNLVPILFQMIENNEIGVCNFTNPGQINLIEIIKKYETITNKKTNILVKNISNDNKRSLSKLQTSKIDKYKPLNIDEAIDKCIKNYNLFSLT